MPLRAVTGCPPAMIWAALKSALAVYLQAWQQKSAWLSRLPAAVCPQATQRWLLNAGLTLSTR